MNPSLNFLYRYQKLLIWVLLFFVLAVGFFVAGDYGMGWDEPTSDSGGIVSLEYLKNPTNPNASLWTHEMRYYGVVFELPLAFVEKTFKLNSHDTYVFRHYATFFLFIIGIYFFYLLCLERFKSAWLPLLGSTFLLLSPRIFADAFYNSKDIPALVFFVISIFTLVRLLNKPNIKNILWHALACALLIDTRLPGIFVPIITLVFFVADFIFIKENRKKWRKSISLIVTYFLTLLPLIILFWPFLWQHPINHFLEAFADMSHFSRQIGLAVLYMGQFTTAPNLPWHYISLWILISTPIIYILLFIAGIGASVKGLFNDFIKYYEERKQDIVVLSWFFGPLLGIIILNSIVYDGWRQLYFIYPALIYLSLVGIETIYSLLINFSVKAQKIIKLIFLSILIVNLSGVLWFMIRNHPYQNLYFNFLVGGQENARKNFEMDYWGLTFRQGLEFVAAHDRDLIIPVSFPAASPGNTLILEPELKKRFIVLTEENIDLAKYIFTNYRWQQYDLMPWENEFYSVKVDGANVMTVFKMH